MHAFPEAEHSSVHNYRQRDLEVEGLWEPAGRQEGRQYQGRELWQIRNKLVASSWLQVYSGFGVIPGADKVGKPRWFLW